MPPFGRSKAAQQTPAATKAPGRYPTTRMRRNRRDDSVRRLVAENTLSVDDLIWTMFVVDGENKREPVDSMPGVVRYTTDVIAEAVNEAYELGIPAVGLFPFTDPSSWEQYDAAHTDGVDTGGFDGGFFDGRYVTFCPWTRTPPPGEVGYHCNYLSYDTTRTFDDSDAWSGYDASTTDGLESIGYNAGAFDGGAFYAAPLYAADGEDFHGRMMRVDTLGRYGAFSLRFCVYGHNGGLCAAVPGPSFLVNTRARF